jgi:hypothetical protein
LETLDRAGLERERIVGFGVGKRASAAWPRLTLERFNGFVKFQLFSF